MRKVIVSNMVSLDGCFAGPNGEIDWFVLDEEFFEYSQALLSQVDTLLFGRVTYEGMASYWVTPQAIADDPIIAEGMNNLPKVVFSKTLDRVEWNNSRLASGDLAEEVRHLKGQPGGDMVIYGSGSIVSALAQLGLIDEYQLIISPVVLGNGKPLFSGLAGNLNLKLLQTKTFGCGSVLHYYQPDTKTA